MNEHTNGTDSFSGCNSLYISFPMDFTVSTKLYYGWKDPTIFALSCFLAIIPSVHCYYMHIPRLSYRSVVFEEFAIIINSISVHESGVVKALSIIV